jgi:hypothetical protein
MFIEKTSVKNKTFFLFVMLNEMKHLLHHVSGDLSRAEDPSLRSG